MPFVPATIDLPPINPWGVSDSRTGPFCSADGSGAVTNYNGAGTPVTVAGHTNIVTIAAPPGQTTPATPTGGVFHGAGSDFNTSSGGVSAPAVFIFVTEDGTISSGNVQNTNGKLVVAYQNADKHDASNSTSRSRPYAALQNLDGICRNTFTTILRMN